jgi:hypothetical protein
MISEYFLISLWHHACGFFMSEKRSKLEILFLELPEVYELAPARLPLQRIIPKMTAVIVGGYKTLFRAEQRFTVGLPRSGAVSADFFNILPKQHGFPPAFFLYYSTSVAHFQSLFALKRE